MVNAAKIAGNLTFVGISRLGGPSPATLAKLVLTAATPPMASVCIVHQAHINHSAARQCATCVPLGQDSNQRARWAGSTEGRDATLPQFLGHAAFMLTDSELLAHCAPISVLLAVIQASARPSRALPAQKASNLIPPSQASVACAQLGL